MEKIEVKAINTLSDYDGLKEQLQSEPGDFIMGMPLEGSISYHRVKIETDRAELAKLQEENQGRRSADHDRTASRLNASIEKSTGAISRLENDIPIIRTMKQMEAARKASEYAAYRDKTLQTLAPQDIPVAFEGRFSSDASLPPFGYLPVDIQNTMQGVAQIVNEASAKLQRTFDDMDEALAVVTSASGFATALTTAQIDAVKGCRLGVVNALRAYISEVHRSRSDLWNANFDASTRRFNDGVQANIDRCTEDVVNALVKVGVVECIAREQALKTPSINAMQGGRIDVTALEGQRIQFMKTLDGLTHHASVLLKQETLKLM